MKNCEKETEKKAIWHGTITKSYKKSKRAFTSFEVQGKFKETGADGFILKPFKLSEFKILYQYL